MFSTISSHFTKQVF